MTAKMEVKALKIDPSLMKADEREILEDLLVTAHNDARRKAEAAMQEKMQALTGGLGLPPGWASSDNGFCGCRSRNRTPDPAAGAAAGARPAFGAARGAASDQEARGADDAAGGALHVAIETIKVCKTCGNSTRKSLHHLHRSPARSSDYRRGRGRRRSLGAGTRRCGDGRYHVLGGVPVAARRHRPGGPDYDALVARAHERG